MKSLTPAVLLVLFANAASAHPGHLAEVAGHGHWLGAAAIGAAIALGAWAALKGKKQQDENSAEDPAEELEEAAA